MDSSTLQHIPPPPQENPKEVNVAAPRSALSILQLCRERDGAHTRTPLPGQERSADPGSAQALPASSLSAYFCRMGWRPGWAPDRKSVV